ncbi:MAG: MBL fold metallo-hydrolase [Deltaproteobacteria bacterium]|nr:MBL fold metallo-hydrolase [Deltaproteobacteria bacterium]
MIIKNLNVGPLMTNCYILGCEDTKEAVVIDPGGDVNNILKALSEDNLKLVQIINTHGHFDHVGGNKRLKEVTGANIVIHPEDAPMLEHLSSAAATFGVSSEDSPPPDTLVNDGDTIKFGNEELKVIHTPGHSPGGICLLTGDMLYAGDTLFQMSIGRTDLPGGSYDELINSIKTKLLVLDEGIKVFSGHTPPTSIGFEKKSNPFLR